MGVGFFLFFFLFLFFSPFLLDDEKGSGFRGEWAQGERGLADWTGYLAIMDGDWIGCSGDGEYRKCKK